MKCLASIGAADERIWPYEISKFAEKPPQSVYDQAAQYKGLVYSRISHDLDEMKSCLAEGYPFVFGFSVYSNFPWSGTGDVMMPGDTDSMLGGHAVLAIGYNDETQRFTWLNSWGQGWGRFGRGTIPYEYLETPWLSDDFWVIKFTE